VELQRGDLDELVDCFHAENRHQRAARWSETEPQGRWRVYDYADLVQRDKCSLDIFWLEDESLEDSAGLDDPDAIAREIAEDLRAALEQFEAIAEDLGA
jgi:type I restriction enzyme M protein